MDAIKRDTDNPRDVASSIGAQSNSDSIPNSHDDNDYNDSIYDNDLHDQRVTLNNSQFHDDDFD